MKTCRLENQLFKGNDFSGCQHLRPNCQFVCSEVPNKTTLSKKDEMKSKITEGHPLEVRMWIQKRISVDQTKHLGKKKIYQYVIFYLFIFFKIQYLTSVTDSLLRFVVANRVNLCQLFKKVPHKERKEFSQNCFECKTKHNHFKLTCHLLIVT